MSTSELPDSPALKAVIFDLDGTLVDTAGDLAAAMNHVLVNNGAAVMAPQACRHLVGSGAKAMLRAGFEQDGGEIPEERVMALLVKDFIAYYHTHIAVHSRPFEGAVAALEVLRGHGVQLAVCTNKPEALARHLLEELGLTHWFAAIIGGDTAGVAKPDPAPVRLCLEAMGFKEGGFEGGGFEAGNRAVFVGDSDTDIRAARATGLPCLVATFGYGPLEELAKADRVFDSYTTMPAMVLEMLA